MKKIKLINADALKASFDERYDDAFAQWHTRDNKEYWNGFCSGINWGRNIITDATAVEPVRHGRWQEYVDPITSSQGYECSECKGSASGGKTKYCPNCGAEMEDWRS